MKAQVNLAILLLFPVVSLAQVPVDEDGNVIGQYEPNADTASAEIALLSAAELEELVGPIALYPDDLLAIVLPASAYPLQVVEAARFLEAYETDSSLEPDENWDDSVVALINYPEVIELLNEDLDWTLRLGDAMAAQQSDVVAAVEAFRDRAYAAGNLQSDEYQTVAEDDGVIRIEPAEEDVIYVPYYEPARVVYRQPEPVYFYYPRPRPVYYYPYAANYHFSYGHFWGVTTAFTIGWGSHSLHTFHHSYYGHPYYGRSYWNHWYRRPSITVYNNYYSPRHRYNRHYYRNGDRWHARERRREYVRREGYARTDRRGNRRTLSVTRNDRQIAFRQRDNRVTPRSPVSRSAQNPSTESRLLRTDRRDLRQSNNRQQTGVRLKDSRRQVPATRSNSTRRQEPAVQPNTNRRQASTNQRQQFERRSGNARTQQPVVRSESRRSQQPAVQPNRKQSRQPAVRLNTRRSQEMAVRSNSRRSPQATVRSQTPGRQAAVRPHRASAPAPRQHRQAPAPQQRQNVSQPGNQKARSIERRSSERRNSGRRNSSSRR